MVVARETTDLLTNADQVAAATKIQVDAAAIAPCLNDTMCVHAGVEADPVSGAMLTPIVQSVAFKQISVERYLELGYSYSRSGNPTVAALEKKIGELEGAKCPAVSFGTGMAATNCLMASFLKSGDHVVVTRCSYGGTNRAIRVLYGRQFGIEYSFVDFTDLTAVRAAIRPNTRMILSETPCNPVLELADLQGLSNIAHEATAMNLKRMESEPVPEENLGEGEGPSWLPLRGRVIHVADCTMATPVVMRGLEFGADVVLLSLTKFYCGHNMSLGGALVTSDQVLYDHMHFKQNVLGSIMAPQTAFYMLQTCKTMALRVRQQSESALKIAQWLEQHPKVESVTYPGLPSHPQYSLAVSQHAEGIHGSMLCFEVKGGSEAGRRVMNASVSPLTLAENLGAVETIITCPSVFTHANMRKEDRVAVGITDGLIRLSVGIENCDDIITALTVALNAA